MPITSIHPLLILVLLIPLMLLLLLLTAFITPDYKHVCEWILHSTQHSIAQTHWHNLYMCMCAIYTYRMYFKCSAEHTYITNIEKKTLLKYVHTSIRIFISFLSFCAWNRPCPISTIVYTFLNVSSLFAFCFFLPSYAFWCSKTQNKCTDISGQFRQCVFFSFIFDRSNAPFLSSSRSSSYQRSILFLDICRYWISSARGESYVKTNRFNIQ